MEAGTVPRLDDRDDLWRVLLMIAANKAANAVRDENRDERGGKVAIHGIAADPDAGGVPVPPGEPDPAEAVALAEEAERLLAALGDAELRRVAELSLAGHATAEIAAELGKVVPAVERKRIREIRARLGFGRAWRVTPQARPSGGDGRVPGRAVGPRRGAGRRPPVGKNPPGGRTVPGPVGAALRRARCDSTYGARTERRPRGRHT